MPCSIFLLGTGVQNFKKHFPYGFFWGATVFDCEYEVERGCKNTPP